MRSRRRAHKPLIVFWGIPFMVLISVMGWMMLRNQSGGWQYVFSEEIPFHKTLPRVFHSLTIQDSSLFVSVTSGYMYSLDRLTGRRNWRHEEQDYSIYPAAFGDPYTVYFSNFDGHLYAVNRMTGKEIWRFGSPDLFRNDTEPIAAGKLVLFGGRNGVLYALDQQTGNAHWTFQTTPIDRSSHVYNLPILHFGRFTADDAYVFVNSSTDNAIVALDQKTGKELWRFARYGFIFQKPTVFQQSIGFWNSAKTYYLLDKSTGNVLYSANTPHTSVYEGKHYIYRINEDQSIDCIDTTNGNRQWTFNDKDMTPTIIREIDSSRALVFGHQKEKTLVTLIDTASGTVLWSKDIQSELVTSIHSNTDHIYSVSSHTLCSLDYQGNVSWCTDTEQSVISSFLTSAGLYLVARDNDNTVITLFNLQDGSRKWQYQSTNINTDSMKEYDGNLYVVSNDNTRVIMLNSNYPHQMLRDTDLKTINDNDGKLTRINWLVSLVKQHVVKRSDITIDTPNKSPKTHDLYELSVHMDDSSYINPHDDANIIGTFTDESGKQYQSGAFYYDKNTWNIRFVPNTPGIWKWNISVKSGIVYHTYQGSFTAEPSNNPGFISIHPNDSRLFSTSDGNIFIPIGIQVCVEDNNHDGNMLDQWPLTTAITPTSDAQSYPTSSLNEYVSINSINGLNVFRWGAGNCSVVLWKTLSPSDNRYALFQGKQLDTLFASLKQHGFHVWMSIFSFSMPFDNSLPLEEKQEILKKYLRYVVNRYAGYVDVWELANEIHIDHTLITFMSDYISSIDPYHHPITTNWDQSDLSSIDITSLHWYAPTCNQSCDEDILQQLPTLIAQKPIVFSEYGNTSVNWDELSATRMRVRLWTAFFNKAYLIFWQTSNALFVSKNGSSNIYIGPVEHQFIRSFHSFVSGQYDMYVQYPTALETKENNIYSVSTGQQIMGYIVNQRADMSPRRTSFRISVPNAGVIQWIHPPTGAIVMTQPILAGLQTLASPLFSVDVAFKILLSGK